MYTKTLRTHKVHGTVELIHYRCGSLPLKKSKVTKLCINK